jgi:small subunit ribosomal protein S1
MPKATEVNLEVEANLETMVGYIRDEEGNLVPDYEMTMVNFNDGDLVSGEVVRIDRDEILVDIGYKSEGVIPIKELALRSDVNPFDIVSLGEKIEALVLQKEDADGRLILSKKRAEYEKSWEKVQQLFEAGEIVSGRVIETVKGGLIIDVGLRGFIPASLVDIRRVKELNSFIGQTVECKIIEVNRNRNNVVLSRRAILEEEKKEQREQVIDSLSQGQVIKGCVSSVVPFGAFVDLDGIDGLIHISELSWDHIDHPSEVLSVGDDVEVQILEVDKSRQRISLGYKQLQPDPWTKSVSKYNMGDILKGTVSRIVPFGVFVSVCDGVEGLIHVSEFDAEHKNAVSDGQEIEVKLIEIDSDKRRLSLSVKQLEVVETEDEPKDDKKEKKASDAQKVVDEAEKIAKKEATSKSAKVIVEKTKDSDVEVKEAKVKKTEGPETASKKKEAAEVVSTAEVKEEIAVNVLDEADKAEAKKTLRKKDKKAQLDENAKVADSDSLEAVLAAMKSDLSSKE